MANRIYIIDIRKCTFIAEVASKAEAKKMKLPVSAFIVTEQDDLKKLKDSVKIKLISAWRGDEIENVKPVALEYRVMNLLTHHVGNIKTTLNEEKKMTKKKVVKKKAPAKKKTVAKKAPAKKKVAAKKKTGGGTQTTARKGVDVDVLRKFVEGLEAKGTDKTTAYKAIRERFNVANCTSQMAKLGRPYKAKAKK